MEEPLLPVVVLYGSCTLFSCHLVAGCPTEHDAGCWQSIFLPVNEAVNNKDERYQRWLWTSHQLQTCFEIYKDHYPTSAFTYLCIAWPLHFLTFAFPDLFTAWPLHSPTSAFPDLCISWPLHCQTLALPDLATADLCISPSYSGNAIDSASKYYHGGNNPSEFWNVVSEIMLFSLFI